MSEGNDINQTGPDSEMRSSSGHSFGAARLEGSHDVESKGGASTDNNNNSNRSSSSNNNSNRSSSSSNNNNNNNSIRKRDLNGPMDSSETLALADTTAPPPSSHATRQVQPGAYAATGRGEGERPVWEHRPPPTRHDPVQEEESLNGSSDQEESPHISELGRSRSRVVSFFRSSLAEASPVGAETVIYATSVSTEAKQKRRRICVILLVIVITAIVVGTVVGVVVFKETRSEDNDEPAGECEIVPRRIMTSRMQCKCFGAIEQVESLVMAWKEVKNDTMLALNFTEAEFNFSHIDCNLENKAIWTMVEAVSNGTHLREVDNKTRSVLPEIVRTAYTATTFYLAFDGDNWSRNDKWLSLSPSCSWFGIECSIAGHISAINMANNNLSGEIKSGIRVPERLRELILGDNHINGTIPTDFFQLSSLKVLDLRNNDLTGVLPESYDMRVLTVLDLSNNSISGSMSSAFFQNMTRLRKLSLDRNQLTGPIPASTQLMTSLEHFEVAFNEINGTLPPNLDQLSLLEIFNVRNNSITGEIPDSYGRLNQIYFIDLSNNQLGGAVPKPLRDCTVNSFIDTILLDCSSFVGNETCPAGDKNCCRCAETFKPYDDILL